VDRRGFFNTVVSVVAAWLERPNRMALTVDEVDSVAFTADEVVYTTYMTPVQVDRMRGEWRRYVIGPDADGTPGADTCTVDCPPGSHRHND